MIPEPLLGAFQASVALDEVVAVIRRLVGAPGCDAPLAAAAVCGTISPSASRVGTTVLTTRRTHMGCSLHADAGSSSRVGIRARNRPGSRHCARAQSMKL